MRVLGGLKPPMMRLNLNPLIHGRDTGSELLVPRGVRKVSSPGSNVVSTAHIDCHHCLLTGCPGVPTSPPFLEELPHSLPSVSAQRPLFSLFRPFQASKHEECSILTRFPLNLALFLILPHVLSLLLILGLSPQMPSPYCWDNLKISPLDL